MATIKTGNGRKRAPKRSAPKQKVKIIFRNKKSGDSGSGPVFYGCVKSVNGKTVTFQGATFQKLVKKDGISQMDYIPGSNEKTYDKDVVAVLYSSAESFNSINGYVHF